MSLSTQHTWFFCWFEHDEHCTFYISFPPFQAPVQDTPHCCFFLLPSKSCSAMICTVSFPSLSWQWPSPSSDLWFLLMAALLCVALSTPWWNGWVFPTSGSIAALDVTGGSCSVPWAHLELLSEIIANVWVVLTAKVLTIREHSSPSYYHMSNRDIWLSGQCSVLCINTL